MLRVWAVIVTVVCLISLSANVLQYLQRSALEHSHAIHLALVEQAYERCQADRDLLLASHDPALERNRAVLGPYRDPLRDSAKDVLVDTARRVCAIQSRDWLERLKAAGLAEGPDSTEFCQYGDPAGLLEE